VSPIGDLNKYREERKTKIEKGCAGKPKRRPERIYCKRGKK